MSIRNNLLWGLLAFALLAIGCKEETENPPQEQNIILPETLPDSFLFKLSWGPIDQPGFIFDIRPDSGMYLSLSDTASEYHVFKPDMEAFAAYFKRLRNHPVFRTDPSNNSPGVLVGHVMVILPDTGYIFPLADSSGQPFPETSALIAEAETEAFRQIGHSAKEITLSLEKGKKNAQYHGVKLSVTQGTTTDIFRTFPELPKRWKEPVYLMRDSALVYVEAMDEAGEIWEWQVPCYLQDTVKGLRVVMEKDEIEVYYQ